jgi:hypothetical protein
MGGKYSMRGEYEKRIKNQVGNLLERDLLEGLGKDNTKKGLMEIGCVWV